MVNGPKNGTRTGVGRELVKYVTIIFQRVYIEIHRYIYWKIHYSYFSLIY
jgi:hypothetical protein